MKRIFNSGALNVIFDDNDFINVIEVDEKRNKVETGGIIVGCYSENMRNAFIKKVEGPPTDSSSGRNYFIRGVKGLASKLMNYWEQNEYYLGEWHSHPNASPCASNQDINQLLSNSIDESLHCPEPIMVIVGVGKKDYSFGVYIVTGGIVSEMKEKTGTVHKYESL